MPERKLKLGVLDQSPVPSGTTHQQALRSTLERARITERMRVGSKRPKSP